MLNPERPTAVILGGGMGGSTSTEGHLATYPERDLSVVVPTTDTGGSTAKVRIYGPGFGDIRRIYSSAAALASDGTNRIGGLLETRFSEETTLADVQDMAEEFRATLKEDLTDSDYHAGLADLAVRNTLDVASDVTHWPIFMKEDRTKSPLQGHTFGNFMGAGFMRNGGPEGQHKGDIRYAAKALGLLIGARANVIPATTNPRDSLFMFDGEQVLEGEHIIDEHPIPNPLDPRVNVWLSRGTRLNPDARDSIVNADTVYIAPGSRATSIGALLTIPGMRPALRQQAENGGNAFAIINLVNERHDTRGFDTRHHLNEIQKRMPRGRILTSGIYNDRPQDVPGDLEAVQHDTEAAETIGVPMIGAPLVGEAVKADANDSLRRSKVRHDIPTALTVADKMSKRELVGASA
jgi:2-phospho-L-lactate transferase/gluconeogenesis factor (CofD/UPF0052 family)